MLRATAAKSTIPVAGECSAATPRQCGSTSPISAAGQAAQPAHAVLAPAPLELAETAQLALVARHDQLAAALVGDGVLLAVGVHLPRPGDAQPGLERTGLVVDAGVDHAAVGAALTAGHVRSALEHDGARAPGGGA